jgi:hypothetical protein
MGAGGRWRLWRPACPRATTGRRAYCRLTLPSRRGAACIMKAAGASPLASCSRSCRGPLPLSAACSRCYFGGHSGRAPRAPARSLRPHGGGHPLGKPLALGSRRQQNLGPWLLLRIYAPPRAAGGIAERSAAMSHNRGVQDIAVPFSLHVLLAVAACANSKKSPPRDPRDPPYHSWRGWLGA